MKASELSNKDLQIGDWVLNVKGIPLQIKGLSNVDGWIGVMCMPKFMIMAHGAIHNASDQSNLHEIF